MAEQCSIPYELETGSEFIDTIVDMKRFYVSAALLSCACLVLTACSASTALDIATAVITGEMAGAIASGWTPGVTYGDAALEAVSCIGTEYNSADAAALKYVAYTACVVSAEQTIPTGNGTQLAIVAGINAALNVLLISEGAQPVPPVSVAVRAHAASVQRVKQYDGHKPSLIVRHEVNDSIKHARLAKK